jgi:N-acetylglucosamine transport system permease protein
LKSALAALGMLAFALAVAVPMLWVLVSSFKSGAEIFESPWTVPAELRTSNYVSAWVSEGIGGYFVNSLIITAATLILLLPIGAMAAYVLARYPFRGSKLVFGTFLGGMMFPHFLVIVPLFVLLRQIGLLDTKEGLILVYVAYSLSFTVFVLFGFFQSLPGELAEAAMIDGCGHSGTFWRIMLPLAKPGVLVVAIFNAIGLWNEYGLALVLLPSKEHRTLPLGIADMAMARQYQADWGALFAGLVIVMLPVMAVYWIFRNRIYEAMLRGAIKG